jgi:hypothetical protein
MYSDIGRQDKPGVTAASATRRPIAVVIGVADNGRGTTSAICQISQVSTQKSLIVQTKLWINGQGKSPSSRVCFDIDIYRCSPARLSNPELDSSFVEDLH